MDKITINKDNYVTTNDFGDGNIQVVVNDTSYVSDGYHTFGELYEHRITLYILLCKKMSGVWRSKKHSDGELAFGGTWFVLGIGKEKGKQITYHLPISHWDETCFAETLEQAPEFDGHTPQDVLERLNETIRLSC